MINPLGRAAAGRRRPAHTACALRHCVRRRSGAAAPLRRLRSSFTHIPKPRRSAVPGSRRRLPSAPPLPPRRPCCCLVAPGRRVVPPPSPPPPAAPCWSSRPPPLPPRRILGCCAEGMDGCEARKMNPRKDRSVASLSTGRVAGPPARAHGPLAAAAASGCGSSSAHLQPPTPPPRARPSRGARSRARGAGRG